MASSTKTKKSTTAKKTRSSGKRKTTGNRKQTRQQTAAGKFETEILILVSLAACVILLVSNFGMGGFVGDAISSFCFGTMGLMAYIFPIAFFGTVAFLISNKSNRLAYKKTVAAWVLYLFLCGAMQLLTESYTTSTTLKDYYALSADYKTGGGIIGGALCISITSAFGVVGSYVILVLAVLVCMIIITQHSLLDFLSNLIMKISDLVKSGQQHYRDGEPERELKKAARAQRRQQMREERIRKLEEELAEDGEFEDDDFEEDDEFLLDPKEAKQMKKTGFLEGTKLTVPGQKETRKKKTAISERKKEDISKTQEKKAADQKDRDLENISENEETDTEAQSEKFPAVDFKIHRADTQADLDMEESDPEDTREDFHENSYSQTDSYDSYAEENSYLEEDSHLEDSYSKEDFYPEEDTYPQEKTPESVQRSRTHTNHSVQEHQSHSSGQGGYSERQPSRNPKSSPAEIQNGIVNIQHEITENAVKREYQFPSLSLLKKGDGKSQGDSDSHLRKTAQKLQEVLHNFGVNVTVTNVSCGPTVTRYELQPEMGVKVSKIVNLADDIKLNLATPDIRIEAPIPGKAAVGIEVPNKENSTVMLRELLQSEEFQKAKSKLSFAVGKDIAGKTVVADIAKMPHLLIAGATGSGKSVCINTLIISILYKAKPEEVKLIMIDPKVVELSVYNGIPHLFIPVVTDPKKAAGALNWAVSEMTTRYNTFAEYGVRNLQEYNKKIESLPVTEGESAPVKMPQIVIIVDELADLMMVAPGEVEDAICRLAQLARAAGIHLIIATQRPSVNVITGLIKANMPSRIAFSVSSGVDSRTILDMNGAEKLLGKGDMLFYPQGYQKPARLQGAFVSDEEVSDVVAFLAEKNPGVQYNTQIQHQVNSPLSAGVNTAEDRDIYFEEAGKFIIEKEKASIGMLQRMFKIGFNRAARIMDQLCDAGVVGPEEGTKPRKVLMSMEEFENYMEEY